jgi:hypothetical protein
MNFNLARVFKKPGHYAATNNQNNQRKIRMKIQLERGYNWDVIPERQRMKGRANALLFALLSLLMLPLAVFAQSGGPFPVPTHGWNLGNTLEPPCGEGCWGPPASQTLINAVADNGFNAVRIPCSWDSNSTGGANQPQLHGAGHGGRELVPRPEHGRHHQLPLGQRVV